jgi:hypothetical protein
MRTALARDKNLLLVSATELYAKRYKVTEAEAFRLFLANNINSLIRKHYNALHTQPLEESFHFADDIIKRKKQ